MFAQWMHHAFPRQCPFRHVRGSADPQAASDWIEQAGNARASENGMQKITDAWAGQVLEDEELTHWTHEEELLVPRTAAPRSSSSLLWGGLRHVMFLSALVAAGVRAASTTGKASIQSSSMVSSK